MRIALCNEVVRDLPIERQAEFAAKLGYDGLELAPFVLDAEAPHRLSARQVGEVRRAVESAGLKVSGLHWLLLAPQDLSITSPDAATRERTLEVMRGLVDLCAGLGGAVLIHGSPAQRALAPGDEAACRGQALDYFRLAAERAEAAGVTYCLEPLAPEQTNYVTTLDEASKIVAAVSSPAFSAMIDCAAAARGEADDIPTLLHRHLPEGLIRHVHFNDPNRKGPGQGALDFLPIVQALSALDYDGWVGVEPFVYEPDGPACAARAIGYVAGLRRAVQ